MEYVHVLQFFIEQNQYVYRIYVYIDRDLL